jgi:nucleoid-associated protein YgaU
MAKATDGVTTPPTQGKESVTGTEVVDQTAAVAAESATPPANGTDIEKNRHLEVRGEVKVREGDSLVELARRRYGFSSWELLKALQNVNPQITNPNYILVGDTVILPAFDEQSLSRMRKGETF